MEETKTDTVEKDEVKEPETKEPENDAQKEKEQTDSKADDKEVKDKDNTKIENAESLELGKAKETIEDLTNQLTTATEQIVELDSVKKELETAKKDIEKANSTVKEYEDLLNKMIEEKMKAIPEEFSDLVPSNMTIPQQLEWLAKADSKGLFKKNKDISDVEIGKPLKANPDLKADLDKMASGSMLSMAYNLIKK